MRIYLLVGILSGCCFAGSSVRAEVIFTFTYFDVNTATGVGFDDPVLGAARRAALEETAMQMGRRIVQDAVVEIGVAPSETDGSGPIGIAVATFNDTTPGIRDGEIYRRIVLGLPDTTPGELDGGMVFDFGYSVALAGTPGPTETYFPDVARHELTHALGYGSFIAMDGTGFNGTAPDMYTRFDSMLTTDGGPNPGLAVIDSGGNLLLDSPTFDFAYATGLVFDGPATRAANGGTPLKLYAGSPTHSGTISDVMFPSPATGYARDDWSPVDVAVLKDLGYAIVPEPSGLALLGVAIGLLLCRRARVSGV